MAPRLERLEEAVNNRPPFLELQPGNLCRGHTDSPVKDAALTARKDGQCISG